MLLASSKVLLTSDWSWEEHCEPKILPFLKKNIFRIAIILSELHTALFLSSSIFFFKTYFDLPFLLKVH